MIPLTLPTCPAAARAHQRTFVCPPLNHPWPQSSGDEELEDEPEGQRRYERRTRHTVQRYSPPKDDQPQLASRGGKRDDRRRSERADRRRRQRGYQQDPEDSEEEEEVREGGREGGRAGGVVPSVAAGAFGSGQAPLLGQQRKQLQVLRAPCMPCTRLMIN